MEVVRGPETSDETTDVVAAFMESIGKKVIVAQKEVPGFILNRLQVALLRESLWLVENGVAEPQDVDIALKYGTGRRWAFAGIFESFDLTDWRTIERAYREIAPSLASSSSVPAPLKDLIERGDIGAKVGRGFYEATPEWVEETRSRTAFGLAGLQRMWADWTTR